MSVRGPLVPGRLPRQTRRMCDGYRAIGNTEIPKMGARVWPKFGLARVAPTRHSFHSHSDPFEEYEYVLARISHEYDLCVQGRCWLANTRMRIHRQLAGTYAKRNQLQVRSEVEKSHMGKSKTIRSLFVCESQEILSRMSSLGMVRKCLAGQTALRLSAVP